MEHKKYIKIDYVDSDQTPKIKYVDVDSRKQRTFVEPAKEDGLLADQLIGICGVCKTLGTVEFPTGFNFSQVDRIEDFKPTQAWCMRCNKKTDFVPVNTKTLPKTDSYGFLEKCQDDIFRQRSTG